jgi:predicted metal-dependent hydrolase
LTLPLPLRNRLAELTLEALRTSEARRALEEVWRFCSGPTPSLLAASLSAGFPLEFFERRGDTLVLKVAYSRFRDELCERIGRAWSLLGGRPLSSTHPSLDTALGEAADLFDAGLYFEVHELLEPYWIGAQGQEQEVLQGLIQVAVGFHHLANGNLEGARSLLDEGSAKLPGRSLGGRPVGPFALAIRQALDAVVRSEAGGITFDWSAVPRFPRE